MLAFVLLTGFLVFRSILAPLGRQSADDLAALMALSARTWTALPPAARPALAETLRDEHGLRLRTTPPPAALTPVRGGTPYMRFLRRAVRRHFGEEAKLYRAAGRWFWVYAPLENASFYFGFSHERIGTRPPRVLIGVLAGAGSFVLLTTLLLVRLVNRPLARLTASVRQLGERGFTDPLPEDGPRELALLARKFNALSQEIRHLLDNRTTLLGGISHDLRTPLARLELTVALLENQADPALLAQMRADIAEMDQIIGRSLELAGLMRAEPSADEKEPLITLLTDLQARYADQGQPFRLETAAAPRRLEVPRLALRRILGNLLENAFRYGGGNVTVTVRRRDDAIDLCVLDSGPGLPETELERVFQPFHRLESSRNSATGGSGLGLAIARQLADSHGWQVTLKNRAVGGLAACVHIPAEVWSPYAKLSPVSDPNSRGSVQP